MEADKNNAQNLAITPMGTDYSQWYLDIIAAAGLAQYSPVKGCMVIRPAGFVLWETVQNVLDTEFKKLGVKNAYFPMLIPERFLKKEASHVEGFAPEVAVVTHAGGEELEEPLVLRPTSETIIYETYKDWVRSYRDLPLLINQWANVIRWEKRTRPFLRTTEFLWQEGHTVHKTVDEADQFSRKMLQVYKDFAENYMAIPIIVGQKSESEKFAGALHTYTCEAIMQDGKALQYATSHNLGDNFAKAFDIQFLDENNNYVYAWQTSWGLSTRSIGGLIMTHSDDKGLVLPPKMAQTKIVILPIFKNENKDSVLSVANDIREKLISNENFSSFDCVLLDDSDKRPGEKHYEWERRGVPVRIEIGERDIAEASLILVRRDTGEKTKVLIDDCVKESSKLLQNIQDDLFTKAKKRVGAQIVKTDSWSEFVTNIENGLCVLAHYDGTTETEKLIKDETGATVRCIPFDEADENGECIKTGAPSKKRVLFAKAY
jgi:prolyl-tRNA synthetase